MSNGSPFAFQSGSGGGSGVLNYSAIVGLGTETSVATDDWIVIGDVTATSADKATLANVILGGAASASDQETATATNRIVTPSIQQRHPSATKAWVSYTFSAGVPTITASYNVSSLTDVATGTADVNFTTAFSSANYAIGTCYTSVDFGAQQQFDSPSAVNTTSKARLRYVSNGSLIDNTGLLSAIFCGDQ